MVEYVRTPTIVWANQKTRVVTWTGLLGTDSGAAVELSNFSDKTIHIFGTWDGATCTLYGSNDPRALVDKNAGTLYGSKTASWIACKDNLDNNIAKSTSDGGYIVIEDYLYNLVVVTGGGANTALTAIISAKKVF